MRDINDTADFIDVRDVIARVEELEAARTEYDGFHNTPGAWAEIGDGEPEELQALVDLLDDLQGRGGDHEWRGDWYPVTLIRGDYFEDYAREYADDIGAVDRHARWPLSHIDWAAAAKDLRSDYLSVDYGPSTYWFR